jgi:Fe-Mn family superoxide dismutase
MSVYSKEANQTSTPFVLPNLPYSKGALVPYLTPENFDYHHDKHHNAYVVKLNELLQNKSELQDLSLEDVIIQSHKEASWLSIFNNAAQVWNHSFYWHCMTQGGGGKPLGPLLTKIEEDFGSFEQFKADFTTKGVTQFGSGWVWLVYSGSKLQILQSGNAGTPIAQGQHPILTCDVWEHAYYIDYRNRRQDYLTTFLEHLVNWEFASENFAKASK